MTGPGPGCLHCGNAIPRSPITAARSRDYCCAGCAAAADWIREAGLDDYYRWRSAAPEPVRGYATDYAAWDEPAFQSAHVTRAAGRAELTLVIDGLNCAACAWLLQRAAVCTAASAEAIVDVARLRATLRWDPESTRLSALLACWARLGYRAGLPGRQADAADLRESRTAIKRLGVAGLGAMHAMMSSEALYFGAGAIDPATRDFFRWIAFLVATPVVFYAGWPILRGAWRELLARRPAMDALVACSVLLAWLASTVETLRGGPDVYFDAAVMFVFLLGAARHLERALRRRATSALDALARAQPDLAVRVEADGTQVVATTTLAAGDLIRVRAGEAVPADGTLVDACAELDESLFSGESLPKLKRRGDAIVAGSICVGSPLELRVQRTGPGTALSQLARLANRAQASRPRAALLADRVAAAFVLAMLVVAAGVAAAWAVLDPARALPAVLAVLAVSCPCALAIAVPAALAAAQARLAREGVLVLSSDALERLARVDRVLLDKTGTLTQGRGTIASVDTYGGLSPAQALAIAAALERQVAHPLARAFDAIDPADEARQVTVDPGDGVEGRVDGVHWRLGRPDYAAGAIDDGSIVLGDGAHAMARFRIVDALRPESARALRALCELGLDPELVSGDSTAAVADAATALGVRRWHARQSPADKLARVRALQAQGHVVAMVGDGINDAQVLAGADVSLAVAEGAALARAHADLVVCGVSRIGRAIAVARGTRRVVRQNLAWAVAYNLAAVPAAALGMLPPWLAALGMSLSSLAVTINALRLARRESGALGSVAHVRDQARVALPARSVA